MIEFVVVFLVVLSCSGVLFIVLYFSPKALPIVNGCWSRLGAFFANCGSRLRAFFADWRASANRKWEQEHLRRLDRDRRRREQNHLLWRWDFKWLLASICVLLFGLFLLWAGDSGQSFLKQALDEHQYYPVKWASHVFWSYEEWESEFNNFGSMAMTGVKIGLISLLGVLVFWRGVLSSLLFCGGSLSTHRGSGGWFEGGASAAAGGRAG